MIVTFFQGNFTASSWVAARYFSIFNIKLTGRLRIKITFEYHNINSFRKISKPKVICTIISMIVNCISIIELITVKSSQNIDLTVPAHTNQTIEFGKI